MKQNEHDVLTASKALAALATANGIPASRIIGTGTTAISLIVSLDDNAVHRAMVVQNDTGCEVHVGGPKFGPNGATFVFADAESATKFVLDATPFLLGSDAAHKAH